MKKYLRTEVNNNTVQGLTITGEWHEIGEEEEFLLHNYSNGKDELFVRHGLAIIELDANKDKKNCLQFLFLIIVIMSTIFGLTFIL